MPAGLDTTFVSVTIALRVLDTGLVTTLTGVDVVCPAGMNTDAGTRAIDGFVFVNGIVMPPAGAAELMVTVKLEFCPPGTEFGVNVICVRTIGLIVS